MNSLSAEFRRYTLSSDGGEAPLLQGLARPARLAPNDVRVAVRAASLNYRDLLIKRGNGSPLTRLVPLSDAAGDLIETGADVTAWKNGDRVMPTFFQRWNDGPFRPGYFGAALGGGVDGVLAEQIGAPDVGLVRIPDHLTYAEAATLPCAAVTAWGALFERGRPLKAGDFLLLQGTGGVAMFGLQFAKAVGAMVVILSSSDVKLTRAKAIGADYGINYVATPNWAGAGRKATGGRGADHILELGGAETFKQSIAAVAAHGTISQIGVLTGYGASPNLNGLFSANASINGIMVGPRAYLESLGHFMRKHAILPVIDRRFGFDHVPEAFEHLEAANHMGKIVIMV